METSQSPGSQDGTAKSVRTLALDVGKRRIGLALSDELGITAQGLMTLERRGKVADLTALAKLVNEHAVRLILIGNPLHMSGEDSAQAQYTREFAASIGHFTGVPVKFWDERLTSREAERALRGSGIAHEKRKAAIDQVSAVILLQSYMASLEFARTWGREE